MAFDGRSISYSLSAPQLFVAKITDSRKIKAYHPKKTLYHDAWVHAWTEQEPLANGTIYQDKANGMKGVVDFPSAMGSAGGGVSGGSTPKLKCPALGLDPLQQVATGTLVFLRKRGHYSFKYAAYTSLTSGSGSGQNAVIGPFDANTESFDILSGVIASTTPGSGGLVSGGSGGSGGSGRSGSGGIGSGGSGGAGSGGSGAGGSGSGRSGGSGQVQVVTDVRCVDGVLTVTKDWIYGAYGP